jgi:hypothetical protein
MANTQSLGFIDFCRLGSDQWREIQSPFGRWFIRNFGPLGTHSRIRNMRVLYKVYDQNWNGKRILDLGTGHGYNLFWLARRYPQAILEGYELDPLEVSACQVTAKDLGLDNLTFTLGSFQMLSIRSK